MFVFWQSKIVVQRKAEKQFNLFCNFACIICIFLARYQLNNVRRSTGLGTNTKIKIFISIVKPVLLYGAETWINQPHYHKENPDIHQHLPQKNSKDSLAEHHQQPKTVATNKTAACRKRHPSKTLEMDWAHPPKACIQHYQVSPHLEPSGEKKERPAKKHLSP